MKKFFATIIILNTLLFVGLSSVAKADDKTSAIIGHVITQAIQGNDMDHTEVFTNELNSLIHTFSIDMIDIIIIGIVLISAAYAVKVVVTTIMAIFNDGK